MAEAMLAAWMAASAREPATLVLPIKTQVAEQEQPDPAA